MLPNKPDRLAELACSQFRRFCVIQRLFVQCSLHSKVNDFLEVRSGEAVRGRCNLGQFVLRVDDISEEPGQQLLPFREARRIEADQPVEAAGSLC